MADPQERMLETHGPFRQPPTIEMTAPSFNNRPKAQNGQKAISYQHELKAGMAPLRLRE